MPGIARFACQLIRLTASTAPFVSAIVPFVLGMEPFVLGSAAFVLGGAAFACGIGAFALGSAAFAFGSAMFVFGGANPRLEQYGLCPHKSDVRVRKCHVCLGGRCACLRRCTVA